MKKERGKLQIGVPYAGGTSHLFRGAQSSSVKWFVNPWKDIAVTWVDIILFSPREEGVFLTIEDRDFQWFVELWKGGLCLGTLLVRLAPGCTIAISKSRGLSGLHIEISFLPCDNSSVGWVALQVSYPHAVVTWWSRLLPPWGATISARGASGLLWQPVWEGQAPAFKCFGMEGHTSLPHTAHWPELVTWHRLTWCAPLGWERLDPQGLLIVSDKFPLFSSAQNPFEGSSLVFRRNPASLI